MYTDAENPALRALEAYAEQRRLFWLNPPRGACGQPGGCALEDTPVILHTGSDGLQRCATHHALLMTRKHDYPCDHCGQGPAFRDPAHRRDEYLCPRCHKKYDSYEPSDRAMVNKTAVRVGVTHSKGLKPLCVARGQGTDCHGQVKPRGGSLKGASLCDFHTDPRGYVRRRQA
jgi:hypothetical protein